MASITNAWSYQHRHLLWFDICDGANLAVCHFRRRYGFGACFRNVISMAGKKTPSELVTSIEWSSTGITGIFLVFARFDQP